MRRLFLTGCLAAGLLISPSAGYAQPSNNSHGMDAALSVVKINVLLAGGALVIGSVALGYFAAFEASAVAAGIVVGYLALDALGAPKVARAPSTDR